MAAPEPDTPVVSVVTVCFNAAATLETCIESVTGQDYPAIEYVVIDGGSTDGTRAILERHRARIDVLVCEPDRGIYDAMNKGIARASGEFVIFMNADDVFAGPGVVREAMRAIARLPRADVYYGSILVRGPFTTIRHDPPPADRATEEMVLGCLPHQATFARRAVFERTGPFDLAWRRHADYDWWLKVMADPALRLQRIDVLVASFRMGGASSDLAKGQPEVFAIQNNSPVYASPEWQRRLLETYQRAFLEARIALARQREEAERARQAGGPWRRAVPRPGEAIAALRGWAVRRLPEPAVATIRSLKHRLRGGQGA